MGVPMSRGGPLAGIRVLDATTPRAELAGRVLADLGADVVKVEPPAGAAARRFVPFERGREGNPEGSLYWAAVALGKRSVVLDPLSEAGADAVRALLPETDVFIESFDPGTLAARGLDYASVRDRNPGLVYASVTPFGQDGPSALAPATELTLEAAGGLVGLQGDGDRPPIPLGFPQAAFHAGVQAAADVVIALCERERSGLGQHLDVSMQAAVVWTLMNATGFPSVTRHDPPGTSETRADPPPQIAPGLDVPKLLRCADGWAFTAIGLPRVGELATHALLRAAEEAGFVPEDLCGRDWSRWIRDLLHGDLTVQEMNRAFAAIVAHTATRKKAEVMRFAVEGGVLIAPVYDVSDLRTDPQLEARGYWTDVGGRIHPGPFARFSETPVEPRAPAPRLGASGSVSWSPRPARSHAPPKPGDGAFAGLKVADFAWVGVGPLIAKALADHGATVVHVESEARVDVLRHLPPFLDDQPGLQRSQFHANFNTSKLGLGLDLSKEAGRAVARRLVDWADVVIESFSPGTMRKLGLDWETLGRERPELVMLSTCLRGQTGPEASYAGFGNQGAALAGLFSITGWPDRPPCGPWGAYTDFIAPRYGVASMAAALYHRARTGRGQYIDLSQVEAAILFLEPLVLDYGANGRVAEAVGHGSPYACPHGVYPAAGKERYVAVAVETAEQWDALREVAPLQEFAAPAFRELHAREHAREAIDARLRAWCQEQDAFLLAERLRAAGVPASPVMRPSDLYADPQLAHRGFFVTVDHAVMGPTRCDGPATRFSRTPARLRRAGPTLGGHTEEVLRDLLGLSEEEITELAIGGVLT